MSLSEKCTICSWCLLWLCHLNTLLLSGKALIPTHMRYWRLHFLWLQIQVYSNSVYLMSDPSLVMKHLESLQYIFKLSAGNCSTILCVEGMCASMLEHHESLGFKLSQFVSHRFEHALKWYCLVKCCGRISTSRTIYIFIFGSKARSHVFNSSKPHSVHRSFIFNRTTNGVRQHLMQIYCQFILQIVGLRFYNWKQNK